MNRETSRMKRNCQLFRRILTSTFLTNNTFQKCRNTPKRLYSQVSSLFNPTVCDQGNRLEVKTPSWPHSLNFSYLWLRDHCKCSECYHSETSQRLLDLYSLSNSIRPTTVGHTSDGIVLNWPDGHSSHFDYEFLWKNSSEGWMSRKTLKKHTWDKKRFPDICDISIPLSLFQTAEGKKQLYERILIYGVGIISEVSPTVEKTEEILEMFGQVQETFFGKVFVFGNDNAYSDLAYSNVSLGAHTDGTYFSESPRIQVFHVLKASKTGGETLLVDGFELARAFRKANPQGYEFLSKFHTPAEYIGDGVHCKTTGPVFKHDVITDQIQQFRYNIYDRANLSTLEYKYVDKYYSHLLELTKMVRDSQNEVWLKLKPGQILFVDNWRVMHGRAAFVGARQLAGCYYGNIDFTSKARTLGIDI